MLTFVSRNSLKLLTSTIISTVKRPFSLISLLKTTCRPGFLLFGYQCMTLRYVTSSPPSPYLSPAPIMSSERSKYGRKYLPSSRHGLQRYISTYSKQKKMEEVKVLCEHTLADLHLHRYTYIHTTLFKSEVPTYYILQSGLDPYIGSKPDCTRYLH